MASIGTLYSTPVHATGIRIRAVAAFAGLKVDLPESYVHFEDNKKPEFLAKFPHGKIPRSRAPMASCFASLAPNSNLIPSDPKAAALVDQWISVSDAEIGTYNNLTFLLVRGMITPYAKPFHATLTERLIRGLETVESYLATHTFLVGERITLADITFASVILRALQVSLDASLRAQFPHIMRHFETIVNQPSMKEAWGEITYIEKALAFVPPAKEKKEPKPAPPPAPKAEKPKKPAAEEDDDDDIPGMSPRRRTPSTPSPRLETRYSNKDTRGADGALEWFYANNDTEGYSVWRVDFKYNNELTQTFMSANQIGGFFNRLEASRKYLFGSMGVLGQTNDSIITGTLILRGQDFKPVVDVAPDWESYEYKRLDLSNADDKAFFEGALAWDLEVDGKKWADGKNC
ncbi:elongation factor 1-gamma [Epithele typhae]|uniref:elongation factor 1-gamma n=1 Tax=Epithele typhae TaxID=378194 RepID=UPI002007B0C0|nr:elongation factor 1-gamma [Epithele typhae]KAH9914069.1 elongation factor 1-gamma [Epithele typhae]